MAKRFAIQPGAKLDHIYVSICWSWCCCCRHSHFCYVFRRHLPSLVHFGIHCACVFTFSFLSSHARTPTYSYVYIYTTVATYQSSNRINLKTNSIYLYSRLYGAAPKTQNINFKICARSPIMMFTNLCAEYRRYTLNC